MLLNDLDIPCLASLSASSSSSDDHVPQTINDEFKLPMWYNDKKKQIDDTLIRNLELLTADDPVRKEEGDDDSDAAVIKPRSVYQKVFLPKTSWGDELLQQLGSLYTDDIDFLRDTQELLLHTPFFDSTEVDQQKVDEICGIWKDIKSNPHFLYTFHYIDYPLLKFLNESETFLLISSLYHLSSPIISLLIPVIVLVLPFFIILQMGGDITFSEYLKILFQVIENHAIGKLFTQFNDVNFDEKIYLLLSVFFYFFSFYQNILLCLSFHSTLQKVHDYIKSLSLYLQSCSKKMSDYLKLFANDTKMKSYRSFNVAVKGKMMEMNHFRSQLECISAYCVSAKKIGELGKILKLFYMIYDDTRIENLFLYSFGFNGFMDLYSTISKRVVDGKLQMVDTFLDKHKEEDEKGEKGEKGALQHTVFTDMIYPGIIDDENVVRNNLDLKTNIILTGPNASGKTTLLKAAMINNLLAQQIGCGCFGSNTNIKVVTDFHCYLNIVDTMGRDSLFQSESKRCKSILTKVGRGNDDDDDDDIYRNHFCIFDEIFSGTNPTEAVKCAYGFLTYLTKYKSVRFVLTTHYMDICKKVEESESVDIVNYRMNVSTKPKPAVNDDDDDDDDDDEKRKKQMKAEVLEYTYGLEKGINPVDGGIAILRQLDYPSDIMEIIAGLS